MDETISNTNLANKILIEINETKEIKEEKELFE
jgi:hypothetical protein